MTEDFGRAKVVANEVVKPAKAAPVAASENVQMREHFARQKKVSVRILKEKGDAFVQVNGYTFIVQAGARVEVPEQIAQMLEDAEYI